MLLSLKDIKSKFYNSKLKKNAKFLLKISKILNIS